MSYFKLLALALSALLPLVASCDYPEGGYYALVGVDATGGTLAYWPFMVTEITDDSSLVLGFSLLLPRAGELVEVTINNGPDLARRYWQLAIADADTQAGNLRLELSHSDDSLYLEGAYQGFVDKPGRLVYGRMVPVGGGAAQLVLANGLPPLPEPLNEALYFEVRESSKAEFEEYLGVPVEQARRVAASTCPEFETGGDDEPGFMPGEQAPPTVEPAPEEPTKDKPPPPVMGGRKRNRVR